MGLKNILESSGIFLIKLDFSGKLCENSFYIVPLYFILQIDIGKVRIVNFSLLKFEKFL